MTNRTLCMLAALAIALPCAGTVYYVAPSGNDTANGLSLATAWGTPGKAAATLRADDTVYIRAATYNVPCPSTRWETGVQPAYSGTAGNLISFKGYPGERPRVALNNTRGSDGGAIGAGYRNYILWEGFEATVTAGYAFGVASYAWAPGGGGCVFRDIVCTGNPNLLWGDNNYSGFRIEGVRDVVIENCLMTNFYMSEGGHNICGFMDYNTYHMVVRNNEIRSCYGGIYDKGHDGWTNSFYRNLVRDTQNKGWYDAKSGAGELRECAIYENIFWNIGDTGDSAAINTWYDAPGECRIWNNVVKQNYDWGISWPRYRSAGSPPVVFECWNNIVYVPTTRNSRHSGLHCEVSESLVALGFSDYNCVYSGTAYPNQFATIGYNSAISRADWTAMGGTDAHSFQADPLFVNPASIDVHLQPASPCVHGGVNHDGRVDMGSYTGNPDIGAYPRGNDGTVIGRLPSGTPSVRITSPSGTGTYATSTSNVTLGGTATDDVGIIQVTWTNRATGASGIASGTATWSVSSIALAVGANAIAVRGRDGDGNTGLDAITVTYTPAGMDTTAPYAAQASPASGATGVALDANITFHVLDPGTGVNQGSIVVRVNTQIVTATISGTSADTVVFYNPSSDFTALQTVTVAVTASDLATTPNNLSTSWSFTTLNPVAPDTTAPAVSQQNPAPGTTGIARNTVIRFHLTDAQTGVNQGTVQLRVNGASVTPTFSGTPQDTEVLYDPPTDFAPLATVTVAVDASDTTGNAMATASWSFTVGDELILPPPAPSNLVAYPSTDAITVQFSPSTGPTVIGYYLYYRNGTAGYVKVNIGNVTAYVLTGLEAGTTYHLQVSAYDTADQESAPTAEISATTLGGGGSGQPRVVNELKVYPNRVAAGEVGTLQVEGPAALAGTVTIYSVSGAAVGTVELEDLGTYAHGQPEGDWMAGPGVYILVSSASGDARARLVVTP
jgi:hypothetical protein